MTRKRNNGSSMTNTSAGNERKNITVDVALEKLSKTDPEAGQLLTSFIAKSHQGPMPSPEDLRGYAAVSEDLPDRMMVMAEKSQTEKTKHNEKILDLKAKELTILELEVMQAEHAHIREISIQKMSLSFAFVIVLVCIVGSFYMATLGHITIALAIGGTTVVAVVGAFLKSKMGKDKSVKKDS